MESREEEPQNIQSLSLMFIQMSTSNFRRHYHACRALNLINLLFMGIYNIHQIIYSINQITLGDMNIVNIVGEPPQPARRQQGQLIWKRASSPGKYEKKD